MGDRGNIVFTQKNGDQIFFYTHWTGSELPNILQDALKRGKSRWDDEQYLARIIFSEMIKCDVLETTGYGISTDERDNNHPNLFVLAGKQTVKCDEQEWSFQEFVNLIEPIPDF